MQPSTNENLLELVKNGPALFSGDANEAQIQERIEALRKSSAETSQKQQSCNMGWGWGN